MKNNVDLKRHDVEYAVGDMVFLKIRPYRQISLRQKKNEKLSPKFFGPYTIVERIILVAYKLELPASASIHPVFHVSQLKKMVGDHQLVQTDMLPYVTETHEWKSIPEEISGYSKNKRGSCEVLIKWQGLPPHEATWEDYDKLQYSLEAKRKALNITQAGKIILRTEYILY